MSVRSYFGLINQPEQSGDKLIYATSEGLVKRIKGLEISGDSGEDGQVLASDGNSGLKWATTSGGGGTVPDLAAVMAEGNSAGSDLDMGAFSMTSASDLGISSGGVLSLSSASGVDFGTGTGTEGHVLASKGAAAPEWVIPEIPPASGDLDMSGFNITNCTGIVNPENVTFSVTSEASFSDAVSFTALPECPAVPDSVSQLVNKSYVDDKVASATGVSPDSDANWTVGQTFNDGLSVTGTNFASMNGGAAIAIPGAAYTLVQPTQASYYYAGGASTPGPYGCLLNVWMVEGGEITLQNCNSGMHGLKVQVYNTSTDGQLKINVQNLYNICASGQYNVFGAVTLNHFTFVEFLACATADGSNAWFAISASTGSSNPNFSSN